MDFPKSFRDPLYAELDAKTTAKLGLPEGLLESIRVNGERTNHGQFSKANIATKAQTPYQFIPATRDGIIEKYGIDPTLSPQTASLAAGYLLKESLDRNRGDIAAAVGEYHGGIDRKNWGPINQAYRERVLAGLGPDMTKVVEAYNSGAMSPQQKSEFEQDVQSGAVKLPVGAKLNKAVEVPVGVVAAYNEGRMTPQQQGEFLADLKAGRISIPAGQTVSNEPGAGAAGLIPGQSAQAPAATNPVQPDVSMGVGDALAGLGEGGLVLATAPAGMLNSVRGVIGGIADSVRSGEFGTQAGVENAALGATQGMQAATYAPRTPAGQSMVGAIGSAAEQLVPLSGLAPQLAALQTLAGPAVAAARPAATQVLQKAAAPVQAVAEKAKQLVRSAEEATPGTMGSVGSAGVDAATLRQTAAAELPVPIRLTEGQATRKYEQQRFERETAKDPAMGVLLRNRFEEQNAAIPKNIDAFIDMTGSELTDLRKVGVKVDEALRAKAAADKNRIRVAYRNAEKSGELEAPVNLDAVIAHLNESAPEATVAPILDAARKRAIKIGAAIEGEDGNLVAQPVTLGNAELFRRAINQATNLEPTNIRQAAILKGLIDQSTEGAGGQLYRNARALRTDFARNYENIGVIKDLLGMKRGSSDRRVALEDVFKRSVLDGSLDDVRQVRRLLQTGGENGQQAWRELQGQTLRDIRDKITASAVKDSRGNDVISADKLNKAIKALDADGKLDFIFTKRGAEQLRTLNEVSRDIFTSPPGAVNTSNTASVLAAAFDVMLSGASGAPLPIAQGLKFATERIRQAKTQKRVIRALNRNRTLQ